MFERNELCKYSIVDGCQQYLRYINWNENCVHTYTKANKKSSQKYFIQGVSLCTVTNAKGSQLKYLLKHIKSKIKEAIIGGCKASVVHQQVFGVEH